MCKADISTAEPGTCEPALLCTRPIVSCGSDLHYCALAKTQLADSPRGDMGLSIPVPLLVSPDMATGMGELTLFFLLTLQRTRTFWEAGGP